MLKLAAVFFLGAGTMFYAAPRLTYSGQQIQLFSGAALKVAPDPSNIWSFHDTVTVQPNKTVTVPIVVDFDKNGKMDTELKGARVLVTDIRVSGGFARFPRLLDDSGIRWIVAPAGVDHLTTPLALPVNSGLKVEVTGGFGSAEASIHLIGRLVTM